jgi:CubicO group peptidase (beta-lactamase class C family)
MKALVRRVRPLALALSIALPFFAAPPAPAQQAGPAAHIAAVERSLLPAVQVRGRSYSPATLEQRMRELKVPAVSVAVIHDGKLEWARAWGMADVASGRAATTETLFQAASMSKPVAAMGALRLVADGRLTLDGDVNQWLRSWRIPADSLTAAQPVTLRHLLTHTGGLTVHGFPGYAAGAPVPDVVQVLQGKPPANTAPVRVDQLPGKTWRYSGGGITVAQLLVQDVTGEPFPAFMQRTVLAPIGMVHSTYQQPLPADAAARAATGYRPDGSPVEGRFHTYPEMAAAGLWTTPSDLALWIMELQAAAAGRSARVLSRDMAAQMLRPGPGMWGLGVSVRPAGNGVAFEHGGANEGFRGQFFGFVESGEGVVVLTNSDAGDQLVGQVVQALARSYGWPGYQARELVPAELSPEALRAFVGEYSVPGTPVRVTLALEGGVLFGTQSGGERSELVPLAGDVLALLVNGQVLRVERNAAGQVVALVAGSQRLPKVQ